LTGDMWAMQIAPQKMHARESQVWQVELCCPFTWVCSSVTVSPWLLVVYVLIWLSWSWSSLIFLCSLWIIWCTFFSCHQKFPDLLKFCNLLMIPNFLTPQACGLTHLEPLCRL
jgi:hypothetical protein